MGKLKPLGDRVLIKPLEREEKTSAGILLPDSAKEKPKEGKVVAVGNGRYEDGDLIPMEVKVGDKVIYGRYSGGEEVKVDGEEMIIIKEQDILGIIG